ncbi:diguanylate cyclase [Pelotomaculum isophthalicicum JI]|uniref:Diguanylate cyclase n=1 Tax=Pelotomaculum isophthalicicum JI TaxID=947010 RepID=A0A9X4H0I3_9FIRM|nr:HD domain-containing phosphohydrolase [Pelotomaculum isophthalicicum]MDF9407311.1 diguanylate cyclase [Pelotomaculum isophthalicicum JI]
MFIFLIWRLYRLQLLELTGIQEKLNKSEERYRTLVENINDAIFTLDLYNFITYVSPVIEKLSAFKPDEFKGKSITNFVHSDDSNGLLAMLEKAKTEEVLYECRLINKSGAYRHFRISCGPLFESEKLAGLTGVLNDITARKQAEEALKDSEERFRTLVDDVLDSSAVGIMILDWDFKVVWLNRALESFFLLHREEILGISARNLIDERIKYFFAQPETFAQKLLATYEDNTYVESFECHVSPSEQHQERWLEHYSQPIYSGLYAGGRIEHYYDITERKQVEKQYKYLSLHDSLTGLYNRAFFNEEMHRMEGGSYLPLGIIVCDVDGLKLVNDTMGHEAGNKLLQAAANLLSNCFRKSDIVARIGGDEFVIILPSTDNSTVENACQRLKNAIKKYNKSQPEISLSLSTGFAVSNDITKSSTDLFKEADLNMYREKLSHAQSTRSIIVNTLKKVLEARDFITEGHAERMQEMVVQLAIACGIPDHMLNDLRLFTLFHDLGKIGIPDRILFKPGPLNDDEFLQIKQHCEIGCRIANTVPDLKSIADWILKHHEWFNGKGYPLGLAGEEIPLECRILAIVDAYDAMTSDRPYRKATTVSEAVVELKKCSGEQFDPQLVQKFLSTLPHQ